MRARLLVCVMAVLVAAGVLTAVVVLSGGEEAAVEGAPTFGGVRQLVYGEPVGEGTYRLDETVPCVIDVPAGSVIVYGSVAEHEPAPDDSGGPSVTALLLDEEESSGLHLDPDTCEEAFRVTTSAKADALFDQIMASIRRVE